MNREQNMSGRGTAARDAARSLAAQTKQAKNKGTIVLVEACTHKRAASDGSHASSHNAYDGHTHG